MKKKHILAAALLIALNIFAFQVIGDAGTPMDEPDKPNVCCPTYHRLDCVYSGRQCVRTGPAPVEPEDN